MLSPGTTTGSFGHLLVWLAALIAAGDCQSADVFDLQFASDFSVTPLADQAPDSTPADCTLRRQPQSPCGASESRRSRISRHRGGIFDDLLDLLCGIVFSLSLL